MSLLSADILNSLTKLNDDNVAVAVLYNPDGHNRFIINNWHFQNYLFILGHFILRLTCLPIFVYRYTCT